MAQAPTEAPLRATTGGLVPPGPGWFIVNVARGRRLALAALRRERALRGRGALPAVRHQRAAARAGPDERPLPPRGRAGGLPGAARSARSRSSRARSGSLRAGDFVHLPAGTAHAVVGAGSEPCVILMVGARAEEPTGEYPHSAAADNHEAASPVETDDPAVAYAGVEPAVPVGASTCGCDARPGSPCAARRARRATSSPGVARRRARRARVRGAARRRGQPRALPPDRRARRRAAVARRASCAASAAATSSSR